MSGKHGTRKNMRDTAVKCIRFFENHHTWTVQDLADELGIARKNAAKWVQTFSLTYPIVEIRPARFSHDGGWMAAVYKLEKT